MKEELKDEIIVRLLGDRIGYGRMMQLASQIWAKKLIEEYKLPGTGAFIPVCSNSIKKMHWKWLQEEYPDNFPKVRKYDKKKE